MSVAPEELFDESVSQNLPAPTPIANAIRAARQRKTQLSAEHHEHLKQAQAEEVQARQALTEALQAVEQAQATANVAIGAKVGFVKYLTKSYELGPGDKIEFTTGAITRQTPPE